MLVLFVQSEKRFKDQLSDEMVPTEVELLARDEGHIVSAFRSETFVLLDLYF